MSTRSVDPILKRLVRAADEIAWGTELLRHLGRPCEALESACRLLQRDRLRVADLNGPAFELGIDGTVAFDALVISKCVELSAILHAEGVGPFTRPAVMQRACLNAMLLHEAVHPAQGIGAFAQVQYLKTGMGEFGLPMFDAAADASSCHASAQLELAFAETEITTAVEANYLSATYRIALEFGHRLYRPNNRAGKIARFLATGLSKVLIDASRFGQLDRHRLHPKWVPGAPLILIDTLQTGVLNAVMLSPSPGLLFNAEISLQPEYATLLWRSVDVGTADQTLKLLRSFLERAGIIHL